MNISSFFKILNRKIEKYDKMAKNPFLEPLPVIVVWVEDCDKPYYKNDSL